MIQNQQKGCLRSQNRTRDLSVTIDITAERDKPTTPSGGVQLEAVLGDHIKKQLE